MATAPRKKSQALKLSAAVERFLLSLATDGKSPCTLRDYRQRLRVLLNLLEIRCTEDGELVSITDLKQVTTDALRQVIYILLNEEVGLASGKTPKKVRLAASSVGVYVLTFKSFFGWCYREGLVQANPADARLGLPKTLKKVKATFTTEHIQRMLNACDLSTDIGYRDFTLLLVLFDTGMRLAEIASLMLDNVHEDYVKVLGKGRKEREIGIHANTSMVLWKYIEMHRAPNHPHEQRVFIGLYGEPLQRQSIQALIKRIQVKAGLEDISVHAHLFRHTFAKFYMDNGGDLFSLSRELGHSDVQTTKIYLEDFSSAQARKKHTQFSPVSLIEVKGTARGRKKKR
jgi:integrase/recombinase XerD